MSDRDDDDEATAPDQDPQVKLTPEQEQTFADFMAEFHRVYASAPEHALVAMCLRCGRSFVD